jgi:alpha-D-ribose 1-methylphosphonate 5-triphosphate synthase subunit PhnG
MYEPDGTTSRRHWMAVLARAGLADLEAILARLPNQPVYTVLRPPEEGAVMIEGRAGGTGRRFNLGEATVTRCAVRTADGLSGISYRLGRDRRAAEVAAVIDALLQRLPDGPALHAREIVSLAARQQAARLLASRKAAATKVEFFTLVRGEA